MMKLLLALVTFSLTLIGGDLTIKESSCSVDKTVSNIQKILNNKGLEVFGVIDHGANAKSVAMELQNSKMIIFGNPKLGTKLMQEDMKAGLDLPLKILVYKDDDSKVKIVYRDGSWLAKNHNLKSEERIAKVNNVMDKITTKAGQCKRD